MSLLPKTGELLGPIEPSDLQALSDALLPVCRSLGVAEYTLVLPLPGHAKSLYVYGAPDVAKSCTLYVLRVSEVLAEVNPAARMSGVV